jgi:hypothetical protein
MHQRPAIKVISLKSGQEAFQQIQQAGEGIKLDRSLGAVESATRAGVSIDNMRGRVANASGAFSTASSAAQALAGQVGNASAAMLVAERAGAALAGAVIATGTALRGVDSAVAAGATQFTNLNFGIASGSFIIHANGTAAAE